MCAECGFIKGHATMCPNNPALAGDNPIMKQCPICEREFDEEEMIWSVCDECLAVNMTFAKVHAYGNDRMQETTLNPLWIKFFSPQQIDTILMQHANTTFKFFPTVAQRYVEETARDDESDFADWLVEQKKGGG